LPARQHNYPAIDRKVLAFAAAPSPPTSSCGTALRFLRDLSEDFRDSTEPRFEGLPALLEVLSDLLLFLLGQILKTDETYRP
jgi:hypothetical protein